MARYRTTAEDFEIMGPACGTLWERPIIDALMASRFPDHSQDHLPLSACEIGTLDWEVSDPEMLRGGKRWRETLQTVSDLRKGL